MSDIFISYEHRNRPCAEKLARAFETRGWSVWWDREIQIGHTFDQEIEIALSGATLVMVLWSRLSVESRWVLNEAEEAAQGNKLFPVFIESGVPIPLAFKRIHAADLSHWEGDTSDPAFEQLVAMMAPRIHAARGEQGGGEQIAPLRPPGTDSPDLGPGPFVGAGVDRRQEEAGGLFTRLCANHAGLTGIVAGVFCVNYGETLVETVLKQRYGLGSELGLHLAAAFSGLEGNLTFEAHDVTNWISVYGYSVSYFFLLPVLGLGLMAALWRRADVQAYRLLCLSVAVDYFASLGFFIFFPVPERWAYADSGAILLSDRWSSGLIDALRPISGLDNCFPSTHVSFTVVIILVCYLARVRLRHTVLALGITVILSTFVLGIHWLPDIVAGLAVGGLSVSAARRICARRTSGLAQAPAIAPLPAGGVAPTRIPEAAKA